MVEDTVGFSDPARGARTLSALEEAFVTSGCSSPLEDFSRELVRRLASSPSPDRAATGLLRFSEVFPGRAALFDDLARIPVLFEVLASILGASQYFTDVLVRDPSLFRWLTTTDALTTPLTREGLEAEVARITGTFSTLERRIDALKRMHRREMLRVGAQDILGHADLESTTAALSLLADVVVDSVLAEASRALQDKHGVLPPGRCAVIALGKLGGVELNYSSDIDVLFVYDATPAPGNRKTPRGGGKAGRKRRTALSAEEYFNFLAERTIGHLSQPTHEGYFYRVDIRLRPESGAGIIARAVESYLQYYETRGELWERQMLIKARCVAGDRTLGGEFLQMLEPFVYPRTFFHHPAESIRRLKARIEATVAGEQNVKLMPGGIRDIEFIVQALQLVNGGRHLELREPNTLKAITALERHALLSAAEAVQLREAYRFLRRLEHRLQIQLNTQTHTIPSGPEHRTALARSLGESGDAELLRRVEEHGLRVRAIFRDVLSVPVDTQGPGIESILEGPAPETVLEGFFRAHGLKDLRQAARHLRVLMSGSSLTGGRELDARSRDAFREIARDLFTGIAATCDPDLTLSNLALLAAAQKFPGNLYRLLREQHFRALTVDVCARGVRFVRELARDPLLLESLACDPGTLAQPVLEDVRIPDPVEFRRTMELRAGVRRLLGLTTFSEMTAELTGTADAIVREVTGGVLARSRARGLRLALFAAGKYGTGELLFDADLDLVFVAGGGRGGQAAHTAAEAIVRRLSGISERGRLYDVDARLRPEGRNAPLVTEAEAYGAYLDSRASLWERQSLTRLRFVAGDRALGESIIERAERFVYDTPLPSGWADEVIAMRRKMESRSRTRLSSPLDVKLGPGGMVDVEFTAQVAQLVRGSAARHLRARPTREVLAWAAGEREGGGGGLLTEAEAASLTSAYTLFRDIEHAIRVVLEERTTVLPEKHVLERLARCLDGSSAEQLHARVLRTMRDVRTLFLLVMKRWSGSIR